MIGFPASIERVDEHGAVRRPMPGDALGSALRGVYGNAPPLSAEMVRLLRLLDRPIRGH